MQTPEREFGIKISGLEIYNENVRDLLNTESVGNLKLLDDPEVLLCKITIIFGELINPPLTSHSSSSVFFNVERNRG